MLQAEGTAPATALGREHGQWEGLKASVVQPGTKKNVETRCLVLLLQATGSGN